MVLGAIVCALPSCVPQTEGDSGQSTVDVRGVELRSLLSDATAVHYDTGHGTQVEYMSADGLAYLWYPGNRSIVPGEWHVRIGPRPLGPGPESRNAIGPYAVFEQDPTQPVESTLYICFRYGPDTYNPVTRMRGGNWECSISPANEEWERRTLRSGCQRPVRSRPSWNAARSSPLMISIGSSRNSPTAGAESI